METGIEDQPCLCLIRTNHPFGRSRKCRSGLLILCLLWLSSPLLRGLPLLAWHGHAGFPVQQCGHGRCHPEGLEEVVGAFLGSRMRPPRVGDVGAGTPWAERALILLHVC